MFRCLSCNEVITSGSTSRRFCSVPISPDPARSAAELFDKVQNACEKANTMKAANIAAGLFIAAQVFILLTLDQTSAKIFFMWAAPAVVIWQAWQEICRRNLCLSFN
jgi:hypothetical protein